MRKREIQNAGSQTVDYLFQFDMKDIKHVRSWHSYIPAENRFCAQMGSALAKWVHGRN